jgi:hypothetical protein
MYQGTLAGISNRTDWLLDAEITDPETDELVDLTGAVIALWVTPADHPYEAVLSGSTADGRIAITGTGAFTATFPASSIAVLRAGTYRVFMRATIGGTSHQLLAADLPVIEGGPQ